MAFFRYTIRTRLSVLFGISAILLLLGFSLFVYLFTYNFRRNEFRHRLENRLQEIDLLLRAKPDYPFTVLEHLPAGTLPEEKTYYQQAGKETINIIQNGEKVYLADFTELSKRTILFVSREKRDYLLRYDPLHQNILIVSAIDVFGYTKMQNLRRVLIAGIIIGSLAMAFISWYFPKKALQPISNKIKKARKIGGESLNLRLDVKNDYDELGQLAITFNQMLQRIENAFEVQKNFIRNAAHELRNPVTAISGDAQLALMRNREGEEYRSALKRIKDKSDVLKKLIDRLLILSKIETDKSYTGKTTVRIDELLIDAITSLQNSHPDISFPVKLHIEESTGDAYIVQGDAVMLQVALDNILDNAYKYGKGKPVDIYLRLKQGQPELQVEDRGIGIKKEEREKLFLPFYRTEGVRHIQGIGIGLSLVKSIIGWHGWKIDLLDNFPEGSIVKINFTNSYQHAIR